MQLRFGRLLGPTLLVCGLAGMFIAAAPAASAAVGVTMYDASVTNISDIPANAQIVAGSDAWTSGDFADFPHSQHVKISCSGGSGTYTDQVVDFESKCVFTKTALLSWFAHHSGPATIYVWHGNIATVEADMAGSGYSWYLWVADQTGAQHTYACVPTDNCTVPVIATQWCGYTNCPITNVDESLVTDPAALTQMNVPVLQAITSGSSGTGTSGSSITVSLPAGYAAGDLLVVWLVWNGTGTTPSISGWTNYTKTTSTIGEALFTKVATGSEGSSVSISFASGFVYTVLCADYTDVSSSPLDPAPGNSGQINAASTTITVPGVTTSNTNDELVWFGATTGPSGTIPGSITVPSGFTAETTQDNSASSTVRNSGMIMANEFEPSAGATGSQNGTSSTSVINGGILLGLAG